MRGVRPESTLVVRTCSLVIGKVTGCDIDELNGTTPEEEAGKGIGG